MSVHQEENGTWTSQSWYRDKKGSRRHKVKRGFTTEQEAMDWENAFNADPSAALDTTFEMFYRQVYCVDKADRIREHTWQTKQNMVETKILPFFGKMRFDQIGPIDVIKWQNSLMSATTAKGKRYAPTYLRAINNQLCAIFNHAVKDYGLPVSPCYRTEKMGDKNGGEMAIWTKEEYLAFSKEIMDKPDVFTAFEVLYWDGLRTGECLALVPESVLLDRSIVRVTQSYQRIKGRDVITDPKTPGSKRNVVSPGFLNDELRDYIEQEGIGPGERLFKFTKSRLHHELDRGCQASGVKRIRVHDLRHSHVSLLIDMGYNAHQIAPRVGHSTADITFRYAHLFPDKGQEAMATALDEQMGGR